MEAMVLTEFGDPDRFERRERPTPTPGPTEVLVRVHATSVNPLDCKLRADGTWAGLEPPVVIGHDVSGVVESVGEAVDRFSAGDEVYYTPEIGPTAGSYATHHVADESIVAHKPSTLSHEEAAALPLAGGTAWEGIVARGDVEAGETVLIHGAGGVGSHAVQIASAAGARVYATTSPETVDQTERLGAERAIDYRSSSFESVLEAEGVAGEVDVVFDTIGGTVLTESADVVRPHGKLVTILPPEGEWGVSYRKNLRVQLVFLERERERLVKLGRLVDRGLLEPVVDSVLPLENVAEAHRRVEDGGLTGKIVLAVEE